MVFLVAIFVGTGLGFGLGLAAAKAVATVQRIRSSDWSCIADVRYAFCGREVKSYEDEPLEMWRTWKAYVGNRSAFIL